MSHFAVAAPPAAALQMHALEAKAALVIKGAFVLALGGLLFANGAALVDRVSNGPTASYTVVLKPGLAASGVVAELQNDGLSVDTLARLDSGNALIATMASDQAQALISNDDVAYVQVNRAMQSQQSWLESLTMKFGL